MNKETQHMNAIVQHTYGSADVLQLEQVAVPSIADDEVLVRVHAAGVDRGVWHLMTGQPYLMRVVGFGLTAPKTPTPGMDLAGTVTAVGKDVTRFQPGDEVFGIGTGTFAEFAQAKESKLALKPKDLPFEQAAVVAISGLTALQAVRDVAKVQSGQSVLVVGASGGVGSYAVQIAKAMGATVTAVCSAAKAEAVRELGADHVIDYTSQEITQGDTKYDVILDIAGNRPIHRLRSVLAPKGTLVIVGGESGGKWFGGLDRQLRAMVLSTFTGQRLTSFISKESGEGLLVLKQMIESGQIRPTLDRTFALEETAEAVRYLEQGRARGKVAIAV